MVGQCYQRAVKSTTIESIVNTTLKPKHPASHVPASCFLWHHGKTALSNTNLGVTLPSTIALRSLGGTAKRQWAAFSTVPQSLSHESSGSPTEERCVAAPMLQQTSSKVVK